MAGLDPAIHLLREESWIDGCPAQVRAWRPDALKRFESPKIAVLSIGASSLSSTSVGTRRSGLNGAILSPPPKVEHGRCSNASP
jgi:hypothetical protein